MAIFRRKSKKNENKVNSDRILLILTISLSIIGLLAVADASAPQAVNSFGDKYYLVKQQLVWFAIGLVAMTAVSKIKYTFWETIAVPLMFVNLLLMIVVLIPGIGLKTYGARRWINMGLFSFQPSELAKFTILVYFAKLSKEQKKLISYLIPFSIFALLIMLEPDLGTAIVFSGIAFVQLFLSGIELLRFFAILFLAAASSFVLIITSSYRRQRLMTFLSQSTNPLAESYHIRQVLFGLGLGGLWGVGLGASRQKFLFLPEAATDSILAVIAEELGFFGGLTIILLFAFYVFRGFKIASGSTDQFSKMLAAGITAWIGIQAIVNMGAMTAIIPLTGVPLPFISYGGTSLVMLMTVTGILLNISKYEQKKHKKY